MRDERCREAGTEDKCGCRMEGRRATVVTASPTASARPGPSSTERTPLPSPPLALRLASPRGRRRPPVPRCPLPSLAAEPRLCPGLGCPVPPRLISLNPLAALDTGTRRSPNRRDAGPCADWARGALPGEFSLRPRSGRWALSRRNPMPQAAATAFPLPAEGTPSPTPWSAWPNRLRGQFLGASCRVSPAWVSATCRHVLHAPPLASSPRGRRPPRRGPRTSLALPWGQLGSSGLPWARPAVLPEAALPPKVPTVSP